MHSAPFHISSKRLARRSVKLIGRTALLAVFAAGALVQPTAPVAQASHGAIEKLYVGQQGLDNVAVFNADAISDASTPLTTIDLGAGAEPQELVADDERPYLYVSDSALNEVHVINTLSDSLEYSIPLSASPQGLALSNDGFSLYVATTSRVDKIDTRSRTVVASKVTAAFTPWDVTLSKNEDRVWVTSGVLTGEVRSYNPDTLAQIDSIDPGDSGYGIAADPSNNNRASYADNLTGDVRTFDDVTDSTTTYSAGYTEGPWAIELEPRSPNRYLTTDRGVGATGDRIVELNPSGFSETRVLSNLGGVGADQPSEIAFSATVDRAFVTLTNSNQIAVINLTSGAALTEVANVSLDASAQPYGIEVTSSPKPLTRFAGLNRYDTGALVSQETFGDESVDTLVVASLENFPDSLVAAPLAGLVNGPLLGTRKDALPAETRAEIARIFNDADDPEEDVWVIGGTAVVSDAVLDEIRAINSNLDVQRIAGANRYETSHFVAAEMDTIRGTESTAAFVAKGSDFPDALTAGAVASNQSFNQFLMPILLTESDALNEHAAMYLESAAPLGAIYLAGGTAALSTQVSSDVNGYANSVTRLGGTNRYDTARIIAGYFFPSGPGTAVFALGTKFPDALVAAPFAGLVSLSGTTQSISAPILLVTATSVPSETMGYMTSVGTIQQGFISGGNAAINATVESSLNSLF